MVRRSFKQLAEARDAMDQARAAIATSRLVIERSRRDMNRARPPSELVKKEDQ
jgi:hypothetical protein